MKVGLAQINPTVGDFAANSAAILAAYSSLVKSGAEVVITPELALPGYPPLDLLFKSRFVPQNLAALDALHAQIGEVPLLVGCVDVNTDPGRPFRNTAAILERGKPIRKISKSLLPTYDVFDEARYFQPAEKNEPIEIAGIRCGVTICEDIWSREYLPRPLYDCDPLASLAAQGAKVILNLSASPFEVGKPRRRFEMLAARARTHRVAIAYCNTVGGNDQLIFDGNSFAISETGECLAQLAPFRTESALAEFKIQNSRFKIPSFQCDEEELFDALVLGTRDYFAKCGFKSAVLGLSGGIDSAVTAVIGAAALGADNVIGVTMPTRYSSEGSVGDSLKLAAALGIRCLTIPIEKSFTAFKEQMLPFFEGKPEDVTEENMQPRLRGMTLMALSNKFGHLLLTTGNKSELAVGYCTLYGDMCGGLAVISDVPKMMIYQLARWLNRDREIIPAATIEKPPSAELRPDQRDQDTLPPYEILDPILELLIEDHLSPDEIIARGFDAQTVRWVVKRVAQNEYKRAQAVPGLKVTSKAFGVGRKMPVAQRFAE
ncbi:MAG: NAD+ synthase [Verrucomicrobia bacterium]|nr:NAD+ synthase [Verrucomicrobiota bacterium]